MAPSEGARPGAVSGALAGEATLSTTPRAPDLLRSAFARAVQRGRLAVSLVAVVLVLACASSPPPPVQGVGSLLPDDPIEDQFGEQHVLGDEVRLVLLTRDMEAGEVARAAIAQAGAASLEGPARVYVSDISGMPSMIARMFAIPKMRDRPYPLLLDRDGRFTARFPSEEGHVTILVVERRRITEIRHLAEPDAIAAWLSGD